MKRKAFFDLAFAKVLISRECEKQNVFCALGLQESVPSAHVQSQVILGSFGICLMSFKHDYRFYLEFFETKRRHESRRNHNTAKPRRSRFGLYNVLEHSRDVVPSVSRFCSFAPKLSWLP